MGLTGESTGAGVLCCCSGVLQIEKETAEDRVIALAGNPNVGKSTVFNSLTGMNQHTGNWPGKTVANAQGRYRYRDTDFILVDIPGTYSLMANSEEEEIARDFICFGRPDAVVVVADATCLERNLNLVLQTMEISDRVVLCVNLLDEAKKKKIRINLAALSRALGIPVVGTSARSGKGLNRLMDAVTALTRDGAETQPMKLTYGTEIETAVSVLQPPLEQVLGGRLNSRWAAIRLLDGEESLIASMRNFLGEDILADESVSTAFREAKALLEQSGLSGDAFRDRIVTRIVEACEAIGRDAVFYEKKEYAERDRKIDRILTSKVTGIPIMILMLCGIFWLTITGANAPSALIADGLFWAEDRLMEFFRWISAPEWVSGLLVEGVYRTLAWVISVMLPPMAIFFPLFTLLEDLGYLPRVAFNLDNFFRKAGAHGKQSLSMCMGFGCNACGVIGCRIIDSPRERLIAILTNNFVPCNGRFAPPKKGRQSGGRAGRIKEGTGRARPAPLLSGIFPCLQGFDDAVENRYFFFPAQPELVHPPFGEPEVDPRGLLRKALPPFLVRHMEPDGFDPFPLQSSHPLLGSVRDMGATPCPMTDFLPFRSFCFRNHIF